MKKILRSFLFLLVLLMFSVSPVFAQDISEYDYEDYLTGGEVLCIEDHSWSMQNTFSYESSLIQAAIGSAKFDTIADFGNNSQTALWETLNTYSEYQKIVLVSDLWNTVGESLSIASDKKMCFIVPYYSNNAEGVKHVEDVIYNVFFEKYKNSEFHVIYLDKIMNTYSNFDGSDVKSDEKAAVETAVEISKEIKLDKNSSKSSIIVFDMSASMSNFLQLLYSQLQELNATKEIDAMYAFASSVSDKINPISLDEQLWEELQYEVGSFSNIPEALRKAASEYNDSHIYLITDMQSTNRAVSGYPDFTGVVTILQYKTDDESDNGYTDLFFKDLSSLYPNAHFERIRAN